MAYNSFDSDRTNIDYLITALFISPMKDDILEYQGIIDISPGRSPNSHLTDGKQHLI
jgi:hypothetical protein